MSWGDARPLARAVSAAVAALTLGLVAAAAPGPGSARADEGDAGGEASGTESGLMGEVTSYGPSVLVPGQPLSTSVRVVNTSVTAIEDVVLDLSVTAASFDSRASLAAFVESPSSAALTHAAQSPAAPEPPPEPDPDDETVPDPDSADQDAEPVEPEPVGITVGPGASVTMSVSASAQDLGLPTGEWGVYGVVLSLVIGEETTVPVDALALTWQDAEVPPLQVAVLATAHGSPTRVSAILDAADVPGVAVAVDPTRVTNASVLRSGLREQERYRLPGGQPDITSLAHAGDEVLLPLALGLPAGSSLANLDDAPWLSLPAAVDRDSVAAAQREGAVATVAMPGAPGFDAAADAGVGMVADVRVGDGTARILVADAGLSETLALYRPGTAAARSRLIAESALAAAEQPAGPLVIAPGESWVLAGPGPSLELSALLMAPWVETVSVADAVEAESAVVSLSDTLDEANDLSADAIEELAGRVEGLTELASTTVQPSASLAAWGGQLVTPLALELRQDPAARAVAVIDALTVTDATLGAVRIADSSDLNLLAESGDIPVTVVNDLDRDVTVVVDLTSFSPNLVVNSRPTLTVPAGEEAVASVSVEAVSSANVGVAVVLRTADGEPVSSARAFQVRVRADWGNAATAVFSVLLVLLLIAGVIRTIRRGRKDTREEPGAAPATVDEEPPAPVAAPEATTATAATATSDAEPDSGEASDRD